MISALQTLVPALRALITASLGLAHILATPAPAAQPDRPGASPTPILAAEPEPIEPALALDTIRAAYGAGVTAERIALRVRTGPQPGAERRDEYTLRIDPGDRPDGSRAVVTIEAGPLRIAAGLGQVVAQHRRDATAYFAAPLPAPAAAPPTSARFAAALRPLPLPQLDLAFPAHAAAAVTPYATDIRWTGAILETPPAPAPQRLVLRADSAAGTLYLVADATTGRLGELAIIPPPHPGAQAPATAPAPQIHLVFTPIDPADIDPLPIPPPPDLRRVAALADLRPRPGDLQPGAIAPVMPLMNTAWQEWNPAEALTPAPARSGQPADAPPPVLALVFVRGVPELADGAGRAAVNAAHAARQQLRPQHDLRVRTVLILDIGGGINERLRAAATVWDDITRAGGPIPGAGGGAGLAGGVGELLWSVSPATTIDRVGPDAPAAVLLLTPDRRVLGAFPIDDATSATTLPDRIRAALVQPQP